MTRKSIVWRWAVVAPCGMIWTVYDTWTKFESVRTPKFFQPDEEDQAWRETARARACAEEDEDFLSDPETITIAKIHLRLDIKQD